MNYLQGKRAYLSGPIQYDTSGVNWRIEPTRVLRDEFKVDLFDPFADPKQQWLPALEAAQAACNYEEMRSIAKRFVRKDLSMVDHSHFVVAYLPYKVPTTGTHHEIISSNEKKKPTILICEQGKQKIPLWYYGFIPHEFMFGSWAEAFAYLKEVDIGLHKDNNRWALTYGIV